jgi:hypothetical protein
MATEIKVEAARQGLSVASLFGQVWRDYVARPRTGSAATPKKRI